MLTRLAKTALIALVAAPGIASAAQTALAQSNIMFVVDASGSMKKQVDGAKTRMAVAKEVLGEALTGLPSDARLGLMAYGHRNAKDCKDIELLSPIGADDAATIASEIEALEPKGETPIAAAITKAARSFAALKGQQNTLVLVTDGIEECDGDPCAAAKAVHDAGLDLKVSIVGFTLSAKDRAAIECVARETGGTYYDARNGAALSQALAAVQKQAVAPEPEPAPAPKPAPVDPRKNLLAKDNGGELLAAPNEVWSRTVDGKENYDYWLNVNQEGVYGFKDGQSATFDTFAQYINQANVQTAKDIELLAGDEGPTGAFRSITTCTFQNIKLLKSLYQECKFPAVTAKYLKVRIISDFSGGDQAYATEFKLMGELGGESTAPAPAPEPEKSSAIDLLAAKNGGEILAAPNDVWLKTVDGAENYDYWLNVNQEGVYGFKDGQAATFDTFAQYINQTNVQTAREIELLAGDEGPTGAFRSITTCTFQNIKLLKSLYQECKFPAVTAKYLKVRIISNFDGGNQAYATEFKLMGEPAAETAAPAPAPVKSGAIDLLAAKNGGEILAAPNDVWLKTVDGAENYDYWLNVNQEGVYGFKDGQAATFDTFAQFINQTNVQTAKEIELLAGDKGPTGAFRSITTCTFQNIKLLKSLYQECKFPAVTAKYLKVRIISNFDGGNQAYATEFKLMGEPAAETAAPAPAPVKSGAIDLLAAKNGGEILAAPNDVWLKTVDGAENYDYWLNVNQEGVYGFKDGQAATFDTFAQFINQTNVQTAKEIELLAGDEGPTGAFRSITTCTFQNIKLLKALYQECRFQPVTAKYLKVRIISNFDGGDQAYATEFKLMGQPVP